MVPVNDNWVFFYHRQSLLCIAIVQWQNVVAILNKVQSIQKMILCQLVQKQSSGTAPSI